MNKIRNLFYIIYIINILFLIVFPMWLLLESPNWSDEKKNTPTDPTISIIERTNDVLIMHFIDHLIYWLLFFIMMVLTFIMAIFIITEPLPLKSEVLKDV